MVVSKKITKKVISAKPVKTKEQVEEDVQTAQVKALPKKGCVFCQNKKEPTFIDMVTLKRYISD